MANPQPGKSEARYQEERRIVLGKALVYQARATGNLGDAAAAEALARKSLRGVSVGGVGAGDRAVAREAGQDGGGDRALSRMPS